MIFSKLVVLMQNEKVKIKNWAPPKLSCFSNEINKSDIFVIN